MDDSSSRVAQSELVKLLADNAADIIYRIRLKPELAYDYISPAVEQNLGYSPAEFYADATLAIQTIHPDDRERAMNPHAPPATLRSVHKDGSTVYFEQRLRLVQDDEGEVVAIEGVCRNVTPRVAVEQALRGSEANFRSLIELSPMLVVVLRGPLIVYANPAVAKFMGVERETLLGSRVLDLVHPDERQRLSSMVEKGSLEGAHSPLEGWRVLRPDGTEALSESTSIAISWDGEPAILVVGRDVTERQVLLTRLAASERLASLGTLAAGVAHEINNPLSHVIAEIELALRALQTAPEVSSEAVQSLQSARDGALRIARVVRDIHSFGRVEPLVTGPVDVGAAIERAIDLTWNQVRHHARLVRDFTNVPPVLADESRLVQVVVNLIANAVDAVSDARNGEITIATRASDSAVSVAISDTGKGIPAAQLGHVFDPFFTTKSVGKGMGLGLAICHGIVTQLGGSIQVHSEPGRGTTFHVSLPRSNGSTGANLAAPAGGTLPRARILFIDDEVSLCSAMTRLLQPEHDVVSATRGQEALDLLRSGERFDMIMCDLMMPGMTGMAFFEALQDLPAVDPESVVFMTGGAFGEPAQRFLASVANPCFYKPIDPNQLRQWLRARQLGPVP